jgi:predicted metal-dependent peptidase
MSDMTDQLERKLKKNKIALMRDPRFALWSGIMMVGKTELRDDIPTAATNGRDEFYGRQFVKTLNNKQLRFVILHENLHKAYRHMTIWRKLFEENQRLANMACDYVINLQAVEYDPQETFIEFPKTDMGERMGCYDKRFKGMNAKQVFDILKQEQKDKSDGPNSDGNDGNEAGDGAGQPGSGEGFDEHDWEGAKALTEAENKELSREIDQAIRQGQIAAAKIAGQGEGGRSRELSELLEPKINWRELLREFVSSICNNKDTSSWRRVSRRFIGSDIYMPTLIGERVGRIAVGIDTSGSISEPELTTFLSEVQAICTTVRPEKIDLIYWDGAVAAHEEYDDGNMDTLIQSTKPSGGGGTDPRCMMRYLKRENIKPECIIMLTDGEIYDWGNEWDAPIMWAIHNQYRRDRIYAPVGKTVHIED